MEYASHVWRGSTHTAFLNTKVKDFASSPFFLLTVVYTRYIRRCLRLFSSYPSAVEHPGARTSHCLRSFISFAAKLRNGFLLSVFPSWYYLNAFKRGCRDTFSTYKFTTSLGTLDFDFQEQCFTLFCIFLLCPWAASITIGKKFNISPWPLMIFSACSWCTIASSSAL